MTATRSAFRLPAAALVLWLAACGDASPERAADPTVAGPYPVGVETLVLQDPARGRTLRTEVWYPADESARGQPPAPAGSYLPPELAPIAANATIPLVAVRDAAFSTDGPFPLVVFSHGSGGIRFQNTFQAEHLASHGYLVVAPDHQGNTFFDDGGDREAAVNRPLDVVFLFDVLSGSREADVGDLPRHVDTSRDYGVTGHSFGSFTSLAVAAMDGRTGAVLGMAAPGPLPAQPDVPTLLMIAGEDKTIGLDSNQTMREVYERLAGPRWLVEIPDAGHYSFSFACFTGLSIGSGDGCGEATRFADGSRFSFVDSRRVWQLVDAYSAALFGRHLRGITAYDETLATNLDPAIATLRGDVTR